MKGLTVERLFKLEEAGSIMSEMSVDAAAVMLKAVDPLTDPKLHELVTIIHRHAVARQEYRDAIARFTEGQS